MTWLVQDAGSHTEIFETEDEAIAAAKEAIEIMRVDSCGGEWPDRADEIYIAEIKWQSAFKLHSRGESDGDGGESGQDTYDVVIQKIKET